MSRLERLVHQARPGLDLRSLAVHDDEAVLAGGGEVFRLPLAPSGSRRLAVLVAALPVLRTRLPVAVAVPHWVGVMPDGATPFSAEPLLPGVPAGCLHAGPGAGPAAGAAGAAGQAGAAGAAGAARPPGSLPAGAIAAGQRDGVLAALAEVTAHEARSWGVPGEGRLAVSATLLADHHRGVLTGVTGWRLALTDAPG